MMKLVLVVLTVFCVIAETQSDGYGRPYGPMQYTRIKRVKYSSPPQIFYSRPPVSFPSNGIFSYTPPPNYMMDNNEPPPYPGSLSPGSSYPGNPRPKVSKRPTNEGLGEEDLQKFAKYLTKQDLDKILKFAGHKSKDPYEKHINYRPTTDEHNIIPDQEKYSPKAEDEIKTFSSLVQQIDLDPKFNPYQNKKFSDEYKNVASYVSEPLYQKNNMYQENRQNNDFSNVANYVADPTPLSVFYSDTQYNNNASLDTQESKSQITYSNRPNNGVLITDSKIMPEENLPRPVNLRDDQDFDVSFTNNVPTVVEADPGFIVESFGELPLMNYNSKLDIVSSYHVPHYTVTSSKSQSNGGSSSYAASSYSPSSAKVPVEPAPPSSAAKEQSDAHLKAVRIWSHKSKGTAYTLHNDGTLSLEKPGRPRGSYSYR